MLFDRISWLIRRRSLSKSVPGFGAEILSYATPDVNFSPYVRMYGTTTLTKASIGRHTYFYGSKAGHISIGAFCSIGPGTRLGGMGSHPSNMLSTHPIFYSTRKQSGASFVTKDQFVEFKHTTIGNDVWIGANAIVIDGVTVDDGAIIAAGAVVTKDVPPYAVVGGIPARVIRFRFSSDDIAHLLRIQWWNREDAELRELAELMRSGDVARLASALDAN